MHIKTAAKGIVGKTISGLVVKEGPTGPKSQVYLIFDDNTYFEFFSSSYWIQSGSQICPGGIDEVREFGNDPQRIIFEATAEGLDTSMGK
ncbi:MAG: hypothetical protein DRJ65_19675 [Acidobacteria bacterium]|nr:MAG: hypothetical protein DRJ65_19675 [Acidobacteriota bacterium]